MLHQLSSEEMATRAYNWIQVLPVAGLYNSHLPCPV